MAPSRTPTPTLEDRNGASGLGIDGCLGSEYRATPSLYLSHSDHSPLSPITDHSPQFGSMGSPMPSTAGQNSIGTPSARASPSINSEGGMGPPIAGPRSPFNFQTQTIKDTPAMAKSVRYPNLHLVSSAGVDTRKGTQGQAQAQAPAPEQTNTCKQNIGQRRGHRYKHSSVSTQHQVFLEPPPRAPLALPASLPIPTFTEAWTSMSTDQTRRVAWCACHALISAYVLYSASGSLALTALSHLIFFDAISATICVVVDVFHNFEVWKRSSIRHPFGLERAEVLAGFAMSVFLLFMGFDLISHNLKHILESVGSHTPHHPHSHSPPVPDYHDGDGYSINYISIDFATISSILATLISGIGLKNHARIGRAMRFTYISKLPSLLSNPSHFLTLSTSVTIFLLPHLSSHKTFMYLDRLLCGLIAVCMFFLGIRLAIAQGLMLLMSYSSSTNVTNTSVSDVIQEISTETLVVGIEEARFWQVHYGLCMANLKLRVKGEEGLGRLRERIQVLVRNRLGGGYGKGSGGVRWEVTVQYSVEGRSIL